MFALTRLLRQAGILAWRRGRRCRGRWPLSSLPRVPLAVEALETRIVPTLLGQQLFPADYPWNQNIANAPVAANSATVIAAISPNRSVHPDWGEDSPSNGHQPLYGIPVNIVNGNSPGGGMVTVKIDNYPDESDGVGIPIPMPANPVIEGDFQNGPNTNVASRGDSHLIIWDLTDNTAYEFFQASRPSENSDHQWHAAGETIWNMNTDQFRTLGFTSADAAGLSILAGLARPDEVAQGVINHALRLTLASGLVSDTYTYPASHEVNNHPPGSTNLPMGARLRLKDTTAVDNLIATMGPEAKVVAKAMQQYGLILADIGSSMFVSGASATPDANNNIQFVWDMDDVDSGLEQLTAGDFDVVDLTPRITGISQGGTGSTVTITGQNFSGAAGHISVFFGNNLATNVVVVNDTTITCQVPAGSGTVQVTVQSGISDSIAEDPTENFRHNIDGIFGYGISGGFSFKYGIPSTTVAANASITFNNIDATVTLSAVVSSTGPLTGGTVTFTLFQGSTQIGSPVTGSVNTADGSASVSYTVPGNTPSGSYTIQAAYTPESGSKFANSSDTTHTLTVNPPAAPFSTTTTVSAVSAVNFSLSSQSINLSAMVVSGATGVNEGTVTFTLLLAGNPVGSPKSGNVTGGAASVIYTLPAASAAGTYTISAVFNPPATSTDYTTSSDTTQSLIVNKVATTTTATSKTTTFASGTQSVTLNATVAAGGNPIANEGTVTFTLFLGATQIGSPATSATVSGGAASVSYSLPTGQAAGTYIIKAVYNPGSDYLTSSDSAHTLKINPASTTTTASAATATFSNAGQFVTLNAAVTSTGNTVNEGTVTFTILDGATVIGSATTNNVSAGAASVSYALPGNLPSKTYTIKAVYNPTANYVTSSDSAHNLVLSPAASPSTTVTTAVATSTGSSTASLMAFVTSNNTAVSEGTITFTLLDSMNNVIGTPVTSTTVGPLGATVVYPLPANANGVYTIQAVYNPGIDYSTSTDSTQSLTVERPPVFISNPTTVFSTTGSNSFQVQVFGFPTATITVGPGLPAGVTFHPNGNGTADITGTPAFPLGAYSFNITATNTINAVVNTVVQVFTLVVADPPTFSSSASTTFTVGKAGSFKVTTIPGLPSATTLTRTGALPPGMTLAIAANGTATLSGTPTAAGVFHFSIFASNTLGSTEQDFTATVEQAPAFTSAAATTFLLKPTSLFTITTKGTGPITFTTSSLAALLADGVTFTDNGNGTATIDASAATAPGTFTFTITASNTVHNTVNSVTTPSAAKATQTFTVKIVNGVTSANTTTFTTLSGTTQQFQVTASQPTAILSVTGKLPTGVTFSAATGMISGIPALGSGGKYALTITAKFGTVVTTQAFTLVINDAPQITTFVPPIFTVGVAGTITIKTTGFPIGTLQLSGDTLPLGLVAKDNHNGTFTISGTPKAGTGKAYNLILTASNGIGVDAVQGFTLTVKQAPAFTSPASKNLLLNALATPITITTTGFPAATIAKTGLLPTGMTLLNNGDGTATISGTPSVAGTFTLTFTAGAAKQTFTLKVGSLVPTITSRNSATFGANVAFTFTVTTTGFPAPALSITPGSLPAGVAFHDNGNGTATISGKATAASISTLTLTAANGTTNKTQSFTLTIGQAITTIPGPTNPAAFTVGTKGTFTVGISGAATLSESGKLPTGVTFSPATHMLSGTPAPGTGGSYTFTIVATTATFHSAQTYTLIVQQKPAITSAAAATFTVGVPGTFTVKATGFPVPTFSVTPSLPLGLTLDPVTGVISGIPQAGDTLGTVSYTITATSTFASSLPQTFKLTIDEAPLIKDVGAATQITFTHLMAGTFTIHTSGFPFAVLTTSVPLPAGLTLKSNNDGTFTISGTPLKALAAPLNFIITATAGTLKKSYQTFTLTVL
jgi:hypothetical protein